MKKKLCSWLLALTMALGLLPAAVFAAEDAAIPFTARNGEDVLPAVKSETDYAYTVVTEYDENWNPVTTEERTVDLYVVSADTTVTEVVLDFGEALRIAYAYDANGNYLNACGEYGDGTTGQSAASAADLTACVRVQTPYDANGQSEFLYAVAFDIPAEGPEEPGEPDEPDEPVEDTGSVDDLLSNIAAGYVENSGEWVIMDMAAYEDAVPESPYKTTADTRQTYVDNAITALTAEGAGEAACAKAILILQSIGVDPRTLYPAGSDAPVSAVDSLKALETYSSSAWVAPYTLIALNQGEYDTDELEQSVMTAVLANQGENGSWSEWGDSIQTTANMIAGLAFYYDTDETVKAAVDKAVAFLSAVQKEDGSFDAYGAGSDANTAAMVVIGLSALGIDPDADLRFVKNGCSALDALLSFALADNSAFGYTNNTAANAYATEQGFRALIAASKMMASGAAYNIYDFSGNQVVPGYVGGAPSDGEEEESGGDVPVPDTDITVFFTLRTHFATWIDDLPVELEEDATVADLIYEAADQDEKLSFTDNNGYISSITYDGETWAEFDAGRNSGWKYTVNGAAPVVGMGDRVLEDGDAVVWYYVADYTQDDTDDEGPVTPKEPVEEEEQAVDLPFADTQGHWSENAIAYCYSAGLMSGADEDTFAPDMSVSRAMAVTVLYAMAEKPETDLKAVFDDVSGDTWYTGAVAWAAENGVSGGYDNGNFGPGDAITREQLAVMLWRYAQLLGRDVSVGEDADILGYTDSFEISDWAVSALRWACGAGLMGGYDGAIMPGGQATRGEMAAIVMNYLENVA